MKLNSFSVFYSAVFTFGVIFGTLFFTALSVEAASLYIDPAKSTLYRGDTVKASVRLDVDEQNEECINAIDGVISYGEGIEPIDVSTGNSILSIWLEPPVINNENRTITFAGGIPNGYCGRIDGDPRLTNVLTEIIFRSPGFVIGSASSDVDQVSVEFTPQSTAYLNDGRGTKAKLNTYGAQFFLEKRPGSVLVNDWQDEIEADNIRPQEFSISLQRDEKAFSKKYYIVFNTTDKETGIDHYEVIEEPISSLANFEWGRADAPWIVTRSPYVLEDQTLNSTIRVKAIDKAGNEYVATLVPDKSLRTKAPVGPDSYVKFSGFGLIVLLVALILFSIFAHKKRRSYLARKNIETGESVDETNHDEKFSDISEMSKVSPESEEKD